MISREEALQQQIARYNESIQREQEHQAKPVWLGFVGEEIACGEGEPADAPYISKLGGQPVWMPGQQASEWDKCLLCRRQRVLVSQIYAPLEGVLLSPTETHHHRVIHLFACPSLQCHSTADGWYAVRTQESVFDESSLSASDESTATSDSKPEDSWAAETDDADLELLLAMRNASLNAQSNHTTGNTSKSNSKQNKKTAVVTNKLQPNVGSGDNSNSTTALKEMYLYLELEPDAPQRTIPSRQQQAMQESLADEEWGSESYESTAPSLKTFRAFTKRVARSPEQCIRYSFDGAPLWMAQMQPTTIPACVRCGSKRCFEFQLMPSLVYLHGMRLGETTIEFGVVAIYSCAKSCDSGMTAVREFVLLQSPI